MMRFLYFLSIILLLTQQSLFAYEPDQIIGKLQAEREAGFKARVIEIVDGDTLKLSDGREIRLVGLQAPKIALGRKNFNEWPLGYEAKTALSEIALGKEVTLYYGGRKMDRYGRTLSHLFLEDGKWVQGEMLKQGMARVYSFADNRSVIDEMLTIEHEARSTNQGIWKLDFYKIRPQAESENHTNSFQLVSGKVLEVATVRNNTFLNFGENYRDDFTIVVPSKVKRMFDKADINLSDFEGKNIIVRGWLKYYNGPSINLTHPEQLVIDHRE